MSNILYGVRSLGNVNGVTTLELDTQEGKIIIKPRYSIYHGLQGDVYEYMMGVTNYCEAMDIEYRDYFNMKIMPKAERKIRCKSKRTL